MSLACGIRFLRRLSITSPAGLTCDKRGAPAFLSLRRMCSATDPSSTQAATDEVLFEVRNRTGIITLNRPHKLNTLTDNMMHQIHARLLEWRQSLDKVIIRGAGERAFCAGGDVVAVARAGRRDLTAPGRFFAAEYRVNHLTGTLGLPYVSLISGITMGGGCGLSMHGNYRVCTETTMVAMPEAAIGLLPDVGGSHFLSRLPGRLGLFLALTGHRLKGVDVMHAGLATHCCRQQSVASLLDELVDTEPHHLPAVLQRYTQDFGDRGEFSLRPHLATIDECFADASLAAILRRLAQHSSQFAADTQATMRRQCPLSMAVTVEQLRRGREMDLAQCLAMELRLVIRFTQSSDANFYEGVRALLEDKDQNPVWTPDAVEKISDEDVIQLFSPLPDHQELRLH